MKRELANVGEDRAASSRSMPWAVGGVECRGHADEKVRHDAIQVKSSPQAMPAKLTAVLARLGDPQCGNGVACLWRGDASAPARAG